MGKFALFKNKTIQVILLILTIPLWLPIVNYIFNFLIQAGRIIGTIIRIIGSGNFC